VDPLYLSDLDAELARRIASECGAAAMSPDDFIAAPVDVLSPCAVGGVLHMANAGQLQAWGVCGGANQIVADAATHLRLFEEGLLVVPDLVASAGAVIDGIGDTLMHLRKSERGALIEKLGDTTQVLLAESARRKIPTQVAAERLAMSRLP
jgi:leucine dehydrogenase